MASHLVSDEKLGEPETNRELFALLARGGYLRVELAEKLEAMAGFRNVLVHGYQLVDLDIVRRVLVDDLQDLPRFVAALRERLGRT